MTDLVATADAHSGRLLAGKLGRTGLLFDMHGLLGQDNLQVSRTGHVGVNAAVGSVGSSALLGRPISLGVNDVEVIGVHALHLGIGLGVGEHVQHHLGGLLGPGTLRARYVQELGLGVSPHALREAGKGHRPLVLQHVLQELFGLTHLPTHDGVAHFADVLEVDAQMRATGLGGYLNGVVGGKNWLVDAIMTMGIVE